MLIRAGRGHEEGGAEATSLGELAVRCRACPHPGINLPEDYTNAGPDEKYLYRQTIAVDCNFRLKNRHRSTHQQDVRLSPGWVFFVERTAYMGHVQQHSNQAEVCGNRLINI